MFVILKKQKIYNIIFSISLVLSSLFIFFSRGNTTFQTMSTSLNNKVIIIDAGHGTPDSGTTGVMGTKEKDLNLLVAKKLGNLMVQGGAQVIYTREDDSTIADNMDEKIRNIKRNDMLKRKTIRDSSGADVFISIHMNYFEDSKYNGAQVFYKDDNDESKKLANMIQQYIKAFADPSNVRQAKDSKNNIFILNDTKVPAVLVECGFLSNPDEEKKLLDSSYQDKIAYAIFSGTLKYFSDK